MYTTTDPSTGGLEESRGKDALHVTWNAGCCNINMKQ
jgi:hypothetical protein